MTTNNIGEGSEAPKVMVGLDEFFRKKLMHLCHKPNNNWVVDPFLVKLAEKACETNDINATNNQGETLLMKIFYTGWHKELKQLLLSHPDIDVNKQTNRRKNTALMLAFLWGGDAELLIAHPTIDLTLRNDPNMEVVGAVGPETPLEFARRKGWNGMADLIAAREQEQKTSGTVGKDVTEEVLGILDLSNMKVEKVAEKTRTFPGIDKFEASIAEAIRTYDSRFGTFYNVVAVKMNLEGAGAPEPEDVDLQIMFGVIPEQDSAHFRSFLSKFMEKTPEAQACMMEYFSLVNNYVVNGNRIVTPNKLKTILFGEKLPYRKWIESILNAFERDEVGMTSLLDSILKAEDPLIGNKTFIRNFFPISRNLIEESDITWLDEYYQKYPNEEAESKAPTEDKSRINQIGGRYKELYHRSPQVMPEAINAAQDLLNAVRSAQ